MIPVILESPYAGDVESNLTYVRLCMNDCIKRGEAPLPSHALYTQPNVLDDNDPAERKLGIECGYGWWKGADKIVFYIDRGMSGGMVAAFTRALDTGMAFEFRTLRKTIEVKLPEPIGVSEADLTWSEAFRAGEANMLSEIETQLKHLEILNLIKIVRDDGD